MPKRLSAGAGELAFPGRRDENNQNWRFQIISDGKIWEDFLEDQTISDGRLWEISILNMARSHFYRLPRRFEFGPKPDLDMETQGKSWDSTMSRELYEHWVGLIASQQTCGFPLKSLQDHCALKSTGKSTYII